LLTLSGEAELHVLDFSLKIHAKRVKNDNSLPANALRASDPAAALN
jgi:hypothetical protein